MIRFQIGSIPVTVGPQEFDQFQRPGPRYTSYPPVPAWKGNFTHEDYAAALQRASAPCRSIYVHIPFCQKRCLYCGCNVVVTSRSERADHYVQTLGREMTMVSGLLPDHRPVVQVHWGGGTPTFLTAPQIARVWRSIVESFPISPNAEIGIEVDPRVTTVEQLTVLRDLGFNRLSMGVQDFDPVVQQTVRRVNPPDMVRELMTSARDLGFRSINLDLIHGLPRQTPETFARTLDEVVKLEPDRVAMFAYAHMPERFRHQRALPHDEVPTGMDKLRLFAMGIERLTQAGWAFIGFDHFARAHDELARAHASGTLHRNFMGYTTRAGTDLLAFGASAISGLSDAFARNERDVPDWSAAIEAGHLATAGGYVMTPDDRVRSAVITSLLCNDRVSRAAIDSQFLHAMSREPFDVWFASDLQRLRPMIDAGLVTDDGDTIQVTPKGRLFARTVAMCFDPTLQPAAASA